MIPSYGKIQSNSVKAGNIAVQDHEKFLSTLSDLKTPVSFHFDGADQFEVSMLSIGTKENYAVRPFSIKEFLDSANANDVVNWIYPDLLKFNIIGNIVNIVSDTTALVTGNSQDRDGGGIMKKLQEKVNHAGSPKSLICYFSLCESHSNEIRTKRFEN